MILQRLEALVTELEHDATVRTFYMLVLIAEAFTRTKHALSSLAHLRRYLALAHRLRAIRARSSIASPWNPLTALLELMHAEATRLTTLYGVARPACRTVTPRAAAGVSHRLHPRHRQDVSPLWTHQDGQRTHRDHGLVGRGAAHGADAFSGRAARSTRWMRS